MSGNMHERKTDECAVMNLDDIYLYPYGMHIHTFVHIFHDSTFVLLEIRKSCSMDTNSYSAY